MTTIRNFNAGIGQIVGSYYNVNEKDKIKSITVDLSYDASTNCKGRRVTGAYWVINEDKLSKLQNFFSSDNLILDLNDAIYCDDATLSGKYNSYISDNPIEILNDGKKYVNTNVIYDGEINSATFIFNNNHEIESNRIFFALISELDTTTIKNGSEFLDTSKSLSVKCETGSGFYSKLGHVNYIIPSIDNENSCKVSVLHHFSINYKPVCTIRTERDNDDIEPIYCSDLRYRTWSKPKSDAMITTNESFGDSSTTAQYLYSVIDGGENPNDVDDVSFNVNIGLGNFTTTVKTHIDNKNGFHSDFHLPEGRLSDVIFDSPKETAYKFGNDSDELSQPRWVFKRSRIKFTIPPSRDIRNVIHNKEVVIRYKVETPIHDDNYSNNYKECAYNLTDSKKDISLVICPRDEGVLDNMAFKVRLSRRFKNSSNWCEDTIYEFHTYQKPTVNIAYPKYVRNDSTNLNPNGKDSGFKFPKIITSNMYSNFNGEDSIVNKYVCDALNVIIATPKNDDSGIPQFVRFFLAEYKYGRTGLGGITRTTNDDNGEIDSVSDWKGKDNIQALYRSDNADDYATYEQIITGSSTNRTAYVTNIYSNDGAPLLISGRFSDSTLSDIGKDFKLWTYNKWDAIESENDVTVGNAWCVESTLHDENGVQRRFKYDDTGKLSDELSPNDPEYANGFPKKYVVNEPMIKDHQGAPIETEWWDESKTQIKTVEQPITKAILFRAGYIYLLRIRMFHGAAAGAIGVKYALKNPIIYGKLGTGTYDYSNLINYGGAYPYFQFDEYNGLIEDVIFGELGSFDYTLIPNDLKEELTVDDVVKHGDLHPFAKRIYDAENKVIRYEPWHGPDDGTTGLSLDDVRLNQTYPGFSEVDYTIIEPVCPYTSKSNLVTVHPTCSEIGANQWITFNYRHLAKNLGGIDTYARTKDIKVGASNSFGLTNGGCQNTITRIMNMYDACVRYILNKYIQQRANTSTFYADIYEENTCDDCSNSRIDNEIVSIWIEPLNNRLSGKINDYEYFTSTLRKGKKENGDIDNLISVPLLYKYNITNKTNIGNNENIYASSSDYTYKGESNEFTCKPGVYYYSEYIKNKSEEYSIYEYDKQTNLYNYWPENLIVWRRYSGDKNPNKDIKLIEPLGNVYRWQPIINAVKNNLEEIQIEDNRNEYAKKYSAHNDVTNLTFIDMTNSIQNKKSFSFSTPDLNNIENGSDTMLSIQTKYAYDDYTHRGVDDINYPNGINFANNKDTSNYENRRFCIKEFAGVTNGDPHSVYVRNNIFNPGYSVMYTTNSYKDDADVNNGFKFFISFLQIDKQYGDLFSRVPTSQDCENGLVTGFDYNNKSFNSSNTRNINHLTINVPDERDFNKSINVGNNKNSNNSTPLVRTTHYLYFKTWINTTFHVQVEAQARNVECLGYHLSDSGNEIHNGSKETIKSGLFLFDGEKLQTITSSESSLTDIMETALNDGKIGETNKLVIDSEKLTNNRIKFGNDNGLSQVYAEDNFGWGRCLSADDVSAKKIKYDGSIDDNDDRTTSGGIEVPIQVRYTPLLQPILLSESGKNLNNGDNIILEFGNKNITLINNTASENIKVEFANGNANSNSVHTVTMSEFDLNVCYPYIPENNTYQTRSPNGGNNGVYYDGYHYDADSFPKSTRKGEYVEPANMDFLGGYGICTGYTVLLVPSNPKLDGLKDFEKQMYFNNTNGHWNYFKQPNNYYKHGDFSNIVSSKVIDAGTVLVAYNLQTTEDVTNTSFSNNDRLNYLKEISSWFNAPNDWANKKIKINTTDPHDNTIGRNFQSIKFNFNNLCDGLIWFEDKENPITFKDFKDETGIELDETVNTLNVGVIYDLVIVPTYSNKKIKQFSYIDGSGTLNGEAYGGGNDESTQNIHLAGSNPLVLYNYLQISNMIIENTIDDTGGGGGGRQPSTSRIHETDCAIIFPNVNNEKFNMETGKIKECPGFWLNNSFRLIIRMPSFRKKSERYGSRDMYTIDNMSHGMLNSNDGKTANDFLFEDIQIHIGKIDELKDYGYPDKMHLNLNKLTSKEDLAKAHIISYKHFGDAKYGVFSKRLSESNNDKRELLTGGAIGPEDENYKNRFIEINLSNAQIWSESLNKLVPIYTEYPEGYYIQVRWKSIYAAGTDETQWSNWTGGSTDGGENWWGTYGTDYYVPVRNYTDVHTEFRNYIKESYPGSLINAKVNENEELISATIGKGSYTKFNDGESYYYKGLGNKETTNNVMSDTDTLLVPDNHDLNNDLNNDNNSAIKLNDKLINAYVNNDNPYYDEIMYRVKHDTTFSIPENITNMHQNMWEMLYVDYIVRNLCKLYYKEKNYDSNNYFVTSSTAYRNMIYHLSVPYIDGEPLVMNFKTWGWDDSEYHIFETSETIKEYKGLNNEKSINEKSKDNTTINSERDKGPNTLGNDTNGVNIISDRYKWNRNKYYRKPITKQDFDELNSHLIELLTFIRHNSFTGMTDENKLDTMYGINYVLPANPNELSFDTSRKSIIGHDIIAQPGLTSINNINHTMIDSNYIQNIWNSILIVCKTGELSNEIDELINI